MLHLCDLRAGGILASAGFASALAWNGSKGGGNGHLSVTCEGLGVPTSQPEMIRFFVEDRNHKNLGDTLLFIQKTLVDIGYATGKQAVARVKC